MSKGLTSGFDLSAQVSEETVDRIFRTAYRLGQIPHSIKRNFSQSGAQGEADISFLPPFLNFDIQATHIINPMELNLPLTAHIQVDPPLLLDFNVSANLSIISSVEKRSVLVPPQGRMDFVIVDFTDINEEHFKLEIEEAFEGKEIWEVILKYLVVDMLQNETQEITLSPAVSSSSNGSPGIGYFDVQVYNDISPADLDFLNLLMNIDDTFTQTSTITPFIKAGQDFALAISSEIVYPKIEQVKKERVGQPLPHDDSLILDSLDLYLMNGSILVMGQVTKMIDCWWDAQISFSGLVYLRINNSGDIEAHMENIIVALPWWLVFLAVIFSFVGLILLEVIRGVVKGTVSETFSDLVLFSQAIPQTTGRVEQAPTIKIRNSDIEVRHDGLIISGDISVDIPGDISGDIPGDKSVAANGFVGNRRTLELHVKTCYWVSLMSARNKVVFGSVDEAISLGYNGCWYCLRAFDTG